jgi:hypothetical protein
MATIGAPKATRITTYIVLGVIFLILLITAVGTFRTVKTNTGATNKAAQLQEAFGKAGLPVPEADDITRVLGNDGGAVCANPTNHLNEAMLQASMYNGATGPGMRPVIATANVVEGERLVISIYCPEELADFNNYVTNDLKFAEED